MTDSITPAAILDFWYQPPMSEHWFVSTTDIDEEIRTRFESIWEQTRDGAFSDWKQSAEGCLALCIILDQFPLNMFRGQPTSFSTEQRAVAITKHAVAEGLDQHIPLEKRLFLYLPLMHSENRADQDESVRLFEQAGMDSGFAHHHRSIVEKYGRFPHRNAILSRESTEEELAYLASDEAFTG